MTATENIWAAVKFRAAIPCELEKVRPLTKQARDFFVEQGLSEEELMACELALVEACNNAVLYAGEAGHNSPIEVEISCDDDQIELHVVDHTHGFELPEKNDLPESNSESGRGLFIMRSVMDSVDYLIGKNKNTLVLKRTRSSATPETKRVPADKLQEMTRKLSENDQIISGMAEELSSCYETLSAIFRCGAELGKTNDIRGFSRALCADLLEITDSDWYVLRVFPTDDSRLIVFAATDHERELEPISVPINGRPPEIESRAAASRHDIFFDAKNPLEKNDPLRNFAPDCVGVVHPFLLADSLIGTLAVGKNPTKKPWTAAQTNVIHTFADFLAIQIVNARLQEEQVKNTLVSRELEIAKTIQQALLPKKLPHFPGFGLAGFCESARQVGGDFYDVVQIDDDSALLIIADVMGKGIPAAMFAAILRSLLRAAPEYSQQPAALLARVNRLLFQELSDVEMFITAHLAHLDFKKRKVTSACAGHCPVLLASPCWQKMKALSPEGIPLGILPDAAFAFQTEDLPPQTRLLLYTDGLTDAQNSAGNFFGEQRVLNWFQRSLAEWRTAEELKTSLAAELRAFQGPSAVYDDQTFLILAEEK